MFFKLMFSASALAALAAIPSAPASAQDRTPPDGRFMCQNGKIVDRASGTAAQNWCGLTYKSGCFTLRKGTDDLYRHYGNDVKEAEQCLGPEVGYAGGGGVSVYPERGGYGGGGYYRRHNRPVGDGYTLPFNGYDEYRPRKGSGRPGDGRNLDFNGYDEYRPRSDSARPSGGRDLPFNGYEEYRPRGDSSRPSDGRDLRFNGYDEYRPRGDRSRGDSPRSGKRPSDGSRRDRRGN
jgi:hypothetical protein